MYKIVFTKSAFKEYQKLPKAIKLKTDEALSLLAINPLSDLIKIKKIQGKSNHYRIRVADYRIIYTPLFEQLLIEVIRVGHRRDIYRYF